MQKVNTANCCGAGLETHPIKLCNADDPQWLEMRMQGISASESAAACGVSPWSSPAEIYYRKRGELQPQPESRAMRLGRKMEPIIADEFEAETGLKVVDRQPGLFAHNGVPWVLATPDGVIDGDTLAEFKWMSERRASEALGEQGTDEVPLEWNVQAQQQMFVMGAATVWFGVLVGHDLRVFEVQRHEQAIDGIVARVSDLWGRIKNGNPPEVERHSLDLARQLYGKVEPGEVITLSAPIATDWCRYESIGKAIGKLSKERDTLKARILMELGNAEAGLLPDGRAVRRAVVQKKEYTVPASSYVDCRVVSGKKYL